jgi:cytochrome c oxidase subunit 4
MSETNHAHPTPSLYVKLALVLALVTAVEIALFYLEERIGKGITRPTLVALSFFKFIAVIGWYMHLRYEKGTLRRFFTGGFVLAIGLYGIVLGSFALRALLG